jgi:cation diffusion facilitator family transporter
MAQRRALVAANEAMAGVYARALRAAWAGLVVNLLLAVVKVVAGVVGNSIAMIADAVNSIGDGLSSAAIIGALKVSQRPADEEHPYGHSRAEAVAALTVAVLVGASAVGIGVEALRSLGGDHEGVPLWVLWVAGVNVVVKEVLYRVKRSTAERTGSAALMAGAWDHRSDALCSLAVLVGLAAVRWGGEGWGWADEGAALVVVVVIFAGAVRVYRRSASLLMDEQSEAGVVAVIREVAEGVAGVSGVEKLHARRSGMEVLVDIHVEVEPGLTVEAGHTIAHAVQREVLGRCREVAHVLVHVEPAGRGG